MHDFGSTTSSCFFGQVVLAPVLFFANVIYTGSYWHSRATNRSTHRDSATGGPLRLATLGGVGEESGGSPTAINQSVAHSKYDSVNSTAD